MTCDIGQKRLYEFYFLLPFDLLTFYLAKIIFLKGYGSLFWKFFNFKTKFNELKNIFQGWQRFIMFKNRFLIKIPYLSNLHKERRVGVI
jgi:hypothetical protein